MEQEYIGPTVRAAARPVTEILTAAAIMMAALLPGCGGGGGGASGSGGAVAPITFASTTPTYLYYTDFSGTLTTIDPAAPTVTTNTNPAGFGCTAGGCLAASIVYAGTVASGTISDFHRHAVVFSNSGKIFRQSAVIAGTTVPAAVQVSSAAGLTYGPLPGVFPPVSGTATDLCSLDTDSVNFQTPENSWVFFRQTGADKACGTADDLRFATKLGSDSSIAPIDLVALGLSNVNVVALYDANGAVTGFVAVKGGLLVQLDANLANLSPTTGSPTAITSLEILAGSPDGVRVLLRMNGSIRVYDPVAKSVGAQLALINTLALWNGEKTSDASDFYFVDNTSPTIPTDIQRISLTSLAAAVSVVTEPAGTVITGLTGTANRLVYETSTPGNFAVRSVLKTASAATSSTFLSDGGVIRGVASTGRVYVDLFSQPPTFFVAAVAVNDDGTGLSTHTDASWAVVFFDTTSSLYGSGPNLSQVVLAQRATAGSATDAGAGLTAYDAATHTAGAVLGIVPGDLFGFSLSISSVNLEFAGPRTLIQAFKTSNATFAPDVLYLDVLKVGSLRRVTNTATETEQPVF